MSNFNLISVLLYWVPVEKFRPKKKKKKEKKRASCNFYLTNRWALAL
jgi:hypothetical protein